MDIFPYEKIESDGDLRKKIKEDYHLGSDSIVVFIISVRLKLNEE